MQELVNKVAIITGGGYGIGRQYRAGFCPRRSQSGAGRALGGAAGTPARRSRDWAANASQSSPTLPRPPTARGWRSRRLPVLAAIDILVNNAGIEGATKNTTEMAPEEWREVIDIDLTGTWLATLAVLPAMKQQKSGGIVNISSGSGRRGYPFRAPYSAAKWGVVSLTQTWAGEWGRSGIRVNCICPGPVVGNRIDRVISARAKAMGVPYEQVERGFVSQSAMLRMVTEEEVAKVALFFAGDQSSGVTGQTLNVDAGFIMN